MSAHAAERTPAPAPAAAGMEAGMSPVALLAEIKLVVTAISGEVDLAELSRVVFDSQSHGTHGFAAALAAVLAAADRVFPDPLTRPFLVMVLGVVARHAAPAPPPPAPPAPAPRS